MSLSYAQAPVAGNLARLACDAREPATTIHEYEAACRRMDANLLSERILLETCYALAKYAAVGVSSQKIGLADGLAMVEKGLELTAMVPLGYWTRDSWIHPKDISAPEQTRRSIDNLCRAYRSSVDEIYQNTDSTASAAYPTKSDLLLSIDNIKESIIKNMPEPSQSITDWAFNSVLRFFARTD